MHDILCPIKKHCDIHKFFKHWIGQAVITYETNSVKWRNIDGVFERSYLITKLLLVFEKTYENGL